jgi:hypothetical protein
MPDAAVSRGTLAGALSVGDLSGGTGELTTSSGGTAKAIVTTTAYAARIDREKRVRFMMTILANHAPQRTNCYQLSESKEPERFPHRHPFDQADPPAILPAVSKSITWSSSSG